MFTYTRTPEKDQKGVESKETEGERKEKKENNEKLKQTINKYALGPQAESRGDKVAVSWYDQSFFMTIKSGTRNYASAGPV